MNATGEISSPPSSFWLVRAREKRRNSSGWGLPTNHSAWRPRLTKVESAAASYGARFLNHVRQQQLALGGIIQPGDQDRKIAGGHGQK
jgi:hypothetical protein